MNDYLKNLILTVILLLIFVLAPVLFVGAVLLGLLGLLAAWVCAVLWAAWQVLVAIVGVKP